MRQPTGCSFDFWTQRKLILETRREINRCTFGLLECHFKEMASLNKSHKRDEYILLEYKDISKELPITET